MRKLESMVDGYHEMICDDPRPLPKRVPRPDIDDLGIGYLTQASRWRGNFTVLAVDEDCEPVTCGDDEFRLSAIPVDGIADAVRKLRDGLINAIDTICDQMEFQRDTSDEAMRRSHPREM